MSAFEVLVKAVLGRSGLTFQAIIVAPIVWERGVGAQASVGMLFSIIAIIGFQTHCCGREDEDENNVSATGELVVPTCQLLSPPGGWRGGTGTKVCNQGNVRHQSIRGPLSSPLTYDSV